MRPVHPSIALRRRMHGIDFCQAVHDATDDYPNLLKARKVLARLIVRTSTYIGPKDDAGHWIFASEEHRQQYGRKIHDVVELAKTQGPEMQVGDLGKKLDIESVADIFEVAPDTVTRYPERYGGVKIGRKHLFFENLISERVRKFYALQVDPSREDDMAGTSEDRREDGATPIRDAERGFGLGTQPRPTGADSDPFGLLA